MHDVPGATTRLSLPPLDVRVAASDAVPAPPGPATCLATDVRESLHPWRSPLSGSAQDGVALQEAPLRLMQALLTNTAACGLGVSEPPIVANRCITRICAPLPLPAARGILQAHPATSHLSINCVSACPPANSGKLHTESVVASGSLHSPALQQGQAANHLGSTQLSPVVRPYIPAWPCCPISFCRQQTSWPKTVFPVHQR